MQPVASTATLEQFAGFTVGMQLLRVIERAGIQPDTRQHVRRFDTSLAQQRSSAEQRRCPHDALPRRAVL